VLRGRQRLRRGVSLGEASEDRERKAAESPFVLAPPQASGDEGARLGKPQEKEVSRDRSLLQGVVGGPAVGETPIDPVSELPRPGLGQARRDEVLVDRKLPVGVQGHADGADRLRGARRSAEESREETRASRGGVLHRRPSAE
jgi:hypothetical protein